MKRKNEGQEQKKGDKQLAENDEHVLCDNAGIQTCLNAYQDAVEADATIFTDSARYCSCVYENYIDCVKAACDFALPAAEKAQLEQTLQSMSTGLDKAEGLGKEEEKKKGKKAEGSSSSLRHSFCFLLQSLSF
nr:hypothetical protein BaRGS_009727 [Batillaria attramentaria]